MRTLKPSQVKSLEELRKSPYARMFGCAEMETVAKQTLEFLIKNGDHWDVEIEEIGDLGSVWQLFHCHGDGFQCDFPKEFITNNRVNDKFYEYVTRKDDLSQFRPEILAKLIPDWPI